MAAEKKGQTIVIKKIFVAAGHHGGAWKVALADFMTAMMAFFLVMWLLGQKEETKKSVSDYFSTPSIIEYNYQNFGVEITLEKLFLDFINEPLKAIQSFLEPMDRTPNVLDFGSEKVVSAFLADQLQDVVANMQINPDGFEFDIVDTDLFKKGTAEPNTQFVTTMGKLRGVMTGLEDANVTIQSMIFNQSVTGSNPEVAKNIANERLEIVTAKIKAGLESSTVGVFGDTEIKDQKDFIEGQTVRPNGRIRLHIKQKEIKSDGTSYRKLEQAFGSGDKSLNTYDRFVKQITDKKKKESSQ